MQFVRKVNFSLLSSPFEEGPAAVSSIDRCRRIITAAGEPLFVGNLFRTFYKKISNSSDGTQVKKGEKTCDPPIRLLFGAAHRFHRDLLYCDYRAVYGDFTGSAAGPGGCSEFPQLLRTVSF